MKNTFSSLSKLVAVAACALSLGSCNRAEYAMLPKGGSYHGVTRAATPVPAAATPVAALPAAPVTEAPAAAATFPVEAATPVAAAPEAAVRVAPATAPAVASARPATATKPALVQRLLANKVAKRVDKMTNQLVLKQHRSTAGTTKTTALNSNLKLGIILLVVGALVTLLPGGIFDLIGAIIAIIGLLFILLAILDMV